MAYSEVACLQRPATKQIDDTAMHLIQQSPQTSSATLSISVKYQVHILTYFHGQNN